jgi:hypothetical protein
VLSTDSRRASNSALKSGCSLPVCARASIENLFGYALLLADQQWRIGSRRERRSSLLGSRSDFVPFTRRCAGSRFQRSLFCQRE